MEDIAFFIFFLLAINNMGLKGYNNFYKDYLDLKHTSSVRGIFVMLIFFIIIINLKVIQKNTIMNIL